MLRQWRAVPSVVPLTDPSKPDIMRSTPGLDIEFMSGEKARALVAQGPDGELALWSSSSMGALGEHEESKGVEHFASDLRLPSGQILFTKISAA